MSDAFPTPNQQVWDQWMEKKKSIGDMCQIGLQIGNTRFGSDVSLSQEGG
ncbi:MAG: hypothetical protein IPM89_11610 [Candidatus Competibacteraceae bacterium]|nr:MAG: hypothetical protein IPM89_11610 [Candidatus Competibacteraceae bacterium]